MQPSITVNGWVDSCDDVEWESHCKDKIHLVLNLCKFLINGAFEAGELVFFGVLPIHVNYEDDYDQDQRRDHAKQVVELGSAIGWTEWVVDRQDQVNA